MAKRSCSGRCNTPLEDSAQGLGAAYRPSCVCFVGGCDLPKLRADFCHSHGHQVNGLPYALQAARAARAALPVRVTARSIASGDRREGTGGNSAFLTCFGRGKRPCAFARQTRRRGSCPMLSRDRSVGPGPSQDRVGADRAGRRCSLVGCASLWARCGPLRGGGLTFRTRCLRAQR